MALIRPIFHHDKTMICIIPFRGFEIGKPVKLPRQEMQVAFNCFQVGPNDNPWTLGAIESAKANLMPQIEYHQGNIVEQAMAIWMQFGGRCVENVENYKDEDIEATFKELFPEPEPEEVEEANVSIDDFTRDQLAGFCEANGYEIKKNWSKQKILDAIDEQIPEPEEGDTE